MLGVGIGKHGKNPPSVSMKPLWGSREKKSMDEYDFVWRNPHSALRRIDKAIIMHNKREWLSAIKG